MSSITHMQTDHQTVQVMQKSGDEFVKRLADCWLVADPMNQARLKEAFRPLFERYREHAARVARGPQHYIDMLHELDAAQAARIEQMGVQAGLEVTAAFDQHVANGEGRN